MKRKILLFFVCLLLILTTACSLGDTPTSSVERLLARYNNQDEDILVELDDYIVGNNLTTEQNTKYKNIYIRQFKDMKYEIKEELIDGDKAKVVVQISVYDYYNADREAQLYLSENPDEFINDGVYDESLFIDYKLQSLESTDKVVDYTIEFNLTKVNNNWEVDELTNEQLEKIHGVYAY